MEMKEPDETRGKDGLATVFHGELLCGDRSDLACVHFSPEQRELALTGLRRFVANLEHAYLSPCRSTEEGLREAALVEEAFVQSGLDMFDRALNAAEALPDVSIPAQAAQQARSVIAEVLAETARDWDHRETSIYSGIVAELERGCTLQHVNIELLTDALGKASIAMQHTGRPDEAAGLAALAQKVIGISGARVIIPLCIEQLEVGDRAAYLQLDQIKHRTVDGAQAACRVVEIEGRRVTVALEGSGDLVVFGASGRELQGRGYLIEGEHFFSPL